MRFFVKHNKEVIMTNEEKAQKSIELLKESLLEVIRLLPSNNGGIAGENLKLKNFLCNKKDADSLILLVAKSLEKEGKIERANDAIPEVWRLVS